MGTPNALPRYVQQRRSGYYFRYVVPSQARHLVGRGELKYSLRTRSKRTAQHRASRLAGLLYEVFQLMHPDDLTPERIRERIQKELASWTQDQLEWELDESPKTPEDAEKLARFYEGVAQSYRAMLATGDYSDPTIQARVRELVQSEGVALPSYFALQLGLPTPENQSNKRLYNRIAREYVRAEISLSEATAARRRGEYPSAYSVAPIPPQPPAVSTPTTAPRLTTLWAKYTQEKLTQREWKAATHDGNEATFGEFIEIVGDLPVTEVSRELVLDYLSKLQQLPKANLKKYRGASIPELLEEDIPEPDLRSSRTVKEALGRIKGFFKWCKHTGALDANPADSVSIQSRSKERQPFDSQDLARLFDSREYREGRHRKTWQFWTPLLALYTGARQNEIAQLTLRDIIEIDGVPAIDITDEEVDASVKTSAGFRKVPIHPTLLEIGFMDYVAALRKAGHERLFPDLTKGTRRWGQAVSQWFNRDEAQARGYMVKCGVDKNGGRKVFHSFRHSVITALLRAEVPVPKVQFLVGHEQSLMGATKYYNHGSFEDSVGAIERLDFGLDHGVLRGQWKMPT